MATLKIFRDTSKWDKRKKEWRHLIDFDIEVGWEGQEHPSGVSAAQVAQWLEEGHSNGGWFEGTSTPPRPFIRTMYMPRAKIYIDNWVARYGYKLFEKPRDKRRLDRVSKKLLHWMQHTILEWDEVPNSPTTQKMKGHDDPLIDTGYLYENISLEVKESNRTINHNKKKKKGK